MSGKTTVRVTAPATPRMTLSRMVEMLLARREHGTSSVTLARNAKGETQIEVVVRTAEDGDVRTAEEAEAVAQRAYDRLRSRYPMSSGLVGAAAPTGTGADDGAK